MKKKEFEALLHPKVLKKYKAEEAREKAAKAKSRQQERKREEKRALREFRKEKQKKIQEDWEKESKEIKERKELAWEQVHPGTLELFRLYYDRRIDSTEKNKKIKAFLANYRGAKCERCGYDKFIEVLVFHHRDPEEKRFDISSCIGRVIEAVLIEVEKCDLLCCNCHREVHLKLEEEVQIQS